ncbi:hypothetical protein K0817_008380 [Microbacterium sp. HD4P20]|uniref:hypothetical protein n=1 Tax=Microbacterium sp. HD4P20 TaxID=2864874 RepID=UPI001C63F9AA|nr:hypothetical protein [Microbacterium sp. HD4P20]MCP2636584.1 hypothetical protein [Microbacterium sp. HD4P20]
MGEALDRVAQAIVTAASDEDAIAAIAKLLDIEEKVAADAIYHSSLRELRPANAERLLRRVEQHSSQQE